MTASTRCNFLKTEKQNVFCVVVVVLRGSCKISHPSHLIYASGTLWNRSIVCWWWGSEGITTCGTYSKYWIMIIQWEGTQQTLCSRHWAAWVWLLAPKIALDHFGKKTNLFVCTCIFKMNDNDNNTYWDCWEDDRKLSVSATANSAPLKRAPQWWSLLSSFYQQGHHRVETVRDLSKFQNWLMDKIKRTQRLTKRSL